MTGEILPKQRDKQQSSSEDLKSITFLLAPFQGPKRHGIAFFLIRKASILCHFGAIQRDTAKQTEICPDLITECNGTRNKPISDITKDQSTFPIKPLKALRILHPK
jgi:hypothetical protein